MFYMGGNVIATKGNMFYMGGNVIATKGAIDASN